MLKKIRDSFISISYNLPFLKFEFSTKDLVEPKFIKYEEFRANPQEYKKKYITEEILRYNIQTVKLMDIHLKSKYLLLDIGESFNNYFKNNRKNNLLIIVNDTEKSFEIIFVNTAELYEDYSYVVKRYNKEDPYYENNVKNISFLFAFYAPVTTGISVMSNKKIPFLDTHNIYYLTNKEKKEIMKSVVPFEFKYKKILRFFNSLIIFLLPLAISNYFYFDYKNNLAKKIKEENKVIYSKIYNLDKENSELKKQYNKILNNIKDNRKFFILESIKEIKDNNKNVVNINNKKKGITNDNK